MCCLCMHDTNASFISHIFTYSIIELGQHWFRKSFPIRSQAITSMNTDLSSIEPSLGNWSETKNIKTLPVMKIV